MDETAANPILAGAWVGGLYSGAQTAIKGGSFSEVLKAAAIATGGNAITFNSAGLSVRYGGSYLANKFKIFGINYQSSSVVAHYINGEILSLVQNYTSFSPIAAGLRVGHSGKGNPLSRHSISNFLKP